MPLKKILCHMKLSTVTSVVVTLLFAAIICFLFPQLTEAKNTKTEMPYYIETIKSPQQINDNVSYYDLRVESGKTEKVELKMHNTSDRPLTLLVKVNTARTGTGGNIDYSGDKKSHLAESLTYSFEELVTGDQEVILQAGETKVVPYYIKVPKRSFSGVILGGFYIQEKPVDSGKSKKTGVSIENRYAYVVGCKISETDQSVEQKFALNNPQLKEWNYAPNIQVDLINQASRIISHYELTGSIKKKKGRIVQTITPKTFSMAPDSKYRLLEGIRLESFPPGEYIYELTITGDRKTWELSEKFTISANEIQQVKEQTGLEDSFSKVLKVVIVMIGILIFITVIVLFRRRRKHEKNN
ncbi:DUF916 domain-containing protein [Listeria fleischmannii]|uniref:DUF916 domain-containing protein n=1 Tax=Listeria fleischmannii TaxID=1069827 RepID=A0A841YBK2_9LIST|nr:DUF916 domain-containing protein [Listeria fleischmannii]EIA20384.1 hypothetical protein KKC_07292 [Listeria fleischmannii subsp. coloradonensis]MBC1397640.1 DUF916 domain-containing protein [Listeria fleischmannii]MBC1426819.1 DUF916 domain-containing protein [Listeria fleischmannii]STY33722.1 Bacterial protein of uncharacterised function (DUF916) [Listeria fleischmannii subsp. coloradonensis]